MHHQALAPRASRLMADVLPICGTVLTIAIAMFAFLPVPEGFPGVSARQMTFWGTLAAHMLEGAVAYRAAASMKLTTGACLGWALLTSIAGFGVLRQVRTLANGKAAAADDAKAK